MPSLPHLGWWERPWGTQVATDPLHCLCMRHVRAQYPGATRCWKAPYGIGSPSLLPWQVLCASGRCCFRGPHAVLAATFRCSCQQPVASQNGTSEGLAAPQGSCLVSGDAATSESLAFSAAMGGSVAWTGGWRKEQAPGFFSELSCSSGPTSQAAPPSPETSSPAQMAPLSVGSPSLPTTCDLGETLCGQRCTDIMQDNLNCGSCGNACLGSRTCVAGTCRCPSGECRCCSYHYFSSRSATYDEINMS